MGEFMHAAVPDVAAQAMNCDATRGAVHGRRPNALGRTAMQFDYVQAPARSAAHALAPSRRAIFVRVVAGDKATHGTVLLIASVA